jgi:hypothetical protein
LAGLIDEAVFEMTEASSVVDRGPWVSGDRIDNRPGSSVVEDWRV